MKSMLWTVCVCETRSPARAHHHQMEHDYSSRNSCEQVMISDPKGGKGGQHPEEQEQTFRFSQTSHENMGIGPSDLPQPIMYCWYTQASTAQTDADSN